ncbi:MAG: heat-inducible transcriptional repressor HrcA [Bacilli bacterium]
MLTDRQNKILKLIILEYIKLAHPVSSNLICDTLDCSSATIRSEMAALEEFGLLEKTHTSSGRIPSEAGYRYYVDNLMEAKEMNGEDMLRLQIIFHNQSLQLSDCLTKSLEVISDMTNYTSIVLGTTSHTNKLKEISVVPLTDTSMIIIVITDQGHVEHRNIELSNVSLAEVKKTVELINTLIAGTPIDEISSKLEFEIKPIISRYVKEHEALYNAFYQVFNEFTNKNVSIVGKDRMLEQPEFNSIKKIKELFAKMEDKDIVNKIETDNHDISIYIGKENKLDDDVTVIQTTYKTATDEGTIAVLGPKRMDYSRVVTLLEYIKDNIEEIKEGE